MTGISILIGYALLFTICFLIVRVLRNRMTRTRHYSSLKTVTFGDESAVKPDRWASILSVLVIFLIWGVFTNSKLVPFHVPGPFVGDESFTYTAENAQGDRDQATVFVRVHEKNTEADLPEMGSSDGFAKDDALLVQVWRSQLLKAQDNDQGGDIDGYKIVEVNGESIAPEQSVSTPFGRVFLTAKGTINFTPKAGLQMQPLYLPSPEAVGARFVDLVQNGYKNISLGRHVWISLERVLKGFFFGALLGIPLGYAMGLANWPRGWFDPIVEFMRPVPPLALIPLVIIWFGIGENGKVVLLFLAALWIMAIAARAGVAGVNISKIRAAYSLGASKPQIMRHIIVPNSLPEIFTGARVAMGVCWGTVVAAELVAASEGVGMMIMSAAKFSQTDIVIVGIVLIGIIGFSIDVLMRIVENRLVPWKGRS